MHARAMRRTAKKSSARARAFLATAALGLALVCDASPGLRAEPPVQMQAKQGPRFTPGTLRVASPPDLPATVILRWTGVIAPPMTDRLAKAFDAFKSSRRRFVLVISSSGGSVAEGERVIALLQSIRTTHRFDTVVERGGVCGSMCVPIYLQGAIRYGARTSSWLFHEITRPGTLLGRQRRVGGRYTFLIEKYWIPAGVSRAWVDRMLPLVDGHDYWQTGQELITDHAGIITHPVENRRRRLLDTDEIGIPGAPAEAKAVTGVPPAGETPPAPSESERHGPENKPARD